ncbi:MAG: membrane protein insertion efficiency factor YidD [Candidatus Omnitrophica bacterium]|nr:membrane protein insertion efficiency factor YidD [Candidatus Omnitrophota bacterium]
MQEAKSGLLNILLTLIRIFRNLFPHMILHSCRYLPTCSEYARLAINRHPLPKAIAVICRRLLRCHPFAPPRIDPVI